MAVLDEDRGRTCISIEWGSFNDDRALGPVLTTFDHALDHASLNPGAQRWLGRGESDSVLGSIPALAHTSADPASGP